jgi:predicted double-glycine peptidase
MILYDDKTNHYFLAPPLLTLGLGLSRISFEKKHISNCLDKTIPSPVSQPDRLLMAVKTGCFFISLILSFSGFAETRSVKSLFEMRRENVVVQQWDLSCGAAALTTLLNYQHGDFVTEKEVANALMSRPEYIKFPGLVTIRQGFSLLDLKRYVDARGYKGMGYGQLTLDDLIKKAPIIVPVSIFGYNHFVIFRGIQGNRVLLADPAWGNRTMLVELFENIRIDFPQIGKVGFAISRLDGIEPLNRLAPNANDFVMTR